MEVPKSIFVVSGRYAFTQMDDSLSEFDEEDAQISDSKREPVWFLAVGRLQNAATCVISGRSLDAGAAVYSVLHPETYKHATPTFCSDDSLRMTNTTVATDWETMYRWRRMVKAATESDAGNPAYGGVCPLTFGTGAVALQRSTQSAAVAVDLDREWRTGWRLQLDWVLNSMDAHWRRNALENDASFQALLSGAVDYAVITGVFNAEQASRMAQQWWVNLMSQPRSDLATQELFDLSRVGGDMRNLLPASKTTGIIPVKSMYWTQTMVDVFSDPNVLRAITEATETRGIKQDDAGSALDNWRPFVRPIAAMIRTPETNQHNVMRVPNTVYQFKRSYYGIVVLHNPRNLPVLCRLERVTDQHGAVRTLDDPARLFRAVAAVGQDKSGGIVTAPGVREFELRNGLRAHCRDLATPSGTLVVLPTDVPVVTFNNPAGLVNQPPIMLLFVTFDVADNPLATPSDRAQYNRIIDRDGADLVRHTQFGSFAELEETYETTRAEITRSLQRFNLIISYLSGNGLYPQTRTMTDEELAHQRVGLDPTATGDPKLINPHIGAPYFPPRLCPMAERLIGLRNDPIRWAHHYRPSDVSPALELPPLSLPTIAPATPDYSSSSSSSSSSAATVAASPPLNVVWEEPSSLSSDRL